MIKQKVVAIDGPSGSGKSSVAKEVAASLNLLYIDTGSMFRALGLVAYQYGISFDDEKKMDDLLSNLDFSYGVNEDTLIEINGENLTTQIREHYVSDLASKISSVSTVRNYLLIQQRDLAKKNVCVMEGRDIGTVVFPDSFCKIFLTASEEIRAQRRLDQLIAKGDSSISLKEVLEDVKTRDFNDSNRDVAPLKQAQDAHRVDTSDLAEDQVVEKIKQIVTDMAQKANINL